MERPSLPLQPDVVVTRHAGLIEAAKLCGLNPDVPIVAHATIENVAGRVVLGVLPLDLAAAARAVISPVLHLAPTDRGRELSTSETLERLAGWQLFAVLNGEELANVRTAMSHIYHDGDMVLLQLLPNVRQKLGI